MKHTVLLTLLGFSFLVPPQLLAQGRESFEQYKARQKSEFNSYKEQRRKEFEEYRRQRNQEFAAYLRKAWKAVHPEPVISRPREKDVPPVVTPKENTRPLDLPPTPLPYDEVISVPPPTPQPIPIVPIEALPVTPLAPPQKEQVRTFTFYGTSVKVRYNQDAAIHLASLDENAIADAWLALSEESYTNLLHDCLEIRNSLNLCDWAYLVMLQHMAESIYGKNTDEAVLLMAYVYCQSGYKMRLAIGDDGKLHMMFGSEHTIYDWNYYQLDGEYYYAYNYKSGKVRICEQKFPKERSMSLTIHKVPHFSMKPASISTHQSRSDENMKVSVSANQNFLDFYTSYPTSMYGDNFLTRWAMYANMPMPQHIKQQIYPPLRSALKGCDPLTATNKILNFVQTGFVYEYDDQIWGEDRAFFPEESLHYPYCDCEDRSILLTRLIRDLLGLECILIYYPGHLAAAISFPRNTPTGDYIELNGKRFFIADGTILYGAPVGQTMSEKDNQTAKVILLE